MKIIAVTGCLGFIGKHLTRALLDRGDYVVGIDAETYAADLDALSAFQEFAEFKYVKADIRTLNRLPDCDAVIHLAAETHVDNSIADPTVFAETNVLGTMNLLQLLRGKRDYERPTFVHISTDEVYGSVGPEWRSVDTDPLRPASPYSASKAAADLLVQSWGHTYGVGARIIRPSNCYGHGQYPEKLIPRVVRCLALGRRIPVHASGAQTRQWLHVEDCAQAILTVLDKGQDGEAYNIAGNTETKVVDIVREVVHAYHNGFPPIPWTEYVSFSHTRPGMDTRYAVDDAPLRALGYEPNGNLWKDLPDLVKLERDFLRF
jgi:dTDP-glucose 4,6-dehydratase